MWLRIVKMFLNKRSFECFIIWWTSRSLLISALAFDCLISLKKITPLWSRRSYIIDIYVSSTQQNIAKFFENESVITWYRTGRISQNFVVLQENKKMPHSAFLIILHRKFVMLFDLGGILTSVGYSQSITFRSYPRDFPWVMIILHPSWSENIRISYAFFP